MLMFTTELQKKKKKKKKKQLDRKGPQNNFSEFSKRLLHFKNNSNESNTYL